jgi:hypothetical protein
MQRSLVVSEMCISDRNRIGKCLPSPGFLASKFTKKT